MSTSLDIERNAEYKPLSQAEHPGEEQALLADSEKYDSYSPVLDSTGNNWCSPITRPRFGCLHVSGAFVAGLLTCVVLQLIVNPWCLSSYNKDVGDDDSLAHVAAPSHVGSTERHPFPPTHPTNAIPSYFPSDVGHAGATPTGAEPGVVATAPSYPFHTGAPVLVSPTTKGGAKSSNSKFDVFKYWGNLSPWYSIERGAFGVDSGPEAPSGCAVTGLHFLHRHGARYPTAWGS